MNLIRSAFNFPAVALTVGREQWHLLQPYHSTLCRDKADKVRQSLASSLHEVAKIVGPAQADACLLEPFAWYLRDFDHIQGAVLENISTLLLCFGPEAAQRALELLNESWAEIKNWRRREAVAKDLGNLGAHFVVAGAAEEVLGVLARAFKDRVAAVREQAVYAVRPFLSFREAGARSLTIPSSPAPRYLQHHRRQRPRSQQDLGLPLRLQ